MSVTSSGDSVQVNICYAGGSALITCTRSDTFDLGIRKNGLIRILAIFKEYNSGQCLSSFLYQDSFDLSLNIISSIQSPDPLSSFKILQNPVSDVLRIAFDEMNTKAYFEIQSINGSVISNTSVNSPDFEIDVSFLAPGLYFICLQDGKRRGVKKFVKY
jgi:hypothetical protein